MKNTIQTIIVSLMLALGFNSIALSTEETPQQIAFNQFKASIEDTYPEKIQVSAFLQALKEGQLTREQLLTYLELDREFLAYFKNMLRYAAATETSEWSRELLQNFLWEATETSEEVYQILTEWLRVENENAKSNYSGDPAVVDFSRYLGDAFNNKNFSWAEKLAILWPCYSVYTRVNEALEGQASESWAYSHWQNLFPHTAILEQQSKLEKLIVAELPRGTFLPTSWALVSSEHEFKLMQAAMKE